MTSLIRPSSSTRKPVISFSTGSFTVPIFLKLWTKQTSEAKRVLLILVLKVKIK